MILKSFTKYYIIDKCLSILLDRIKMNIFSYNNSEIIKVGDIFSKIENYYNIHFNCEIIKVKKNNSDIIVVYSYKSFQNNSTKQIKIYNKSYFYFSEVLDHKVILYK